MSRFPILALCLAVAPAFAQAQTAPAQPATPPPAGQTPAGPPPAAVSAVQQAAGAFGQCVETGVAAVPASVTPEAGATNVMSGCATQRQALEQAVQALIATLPEAQRAAGQEQLRTQMAAVEGQIAAGIRQQRAAPATTPAPAPAPTPAH
jgi:hypothetical protein